MNEVLPDYFYYQNHLDLELVESGFPELLKELQGLEKNGVQVMALTARSLLIANRTIQQLRHLHIDFSKGDHRIKRIEKMNFGLAFPSKYKGGIVFCSNNDKGKLLDHFLELVGYKPDIVIFSDDKEKNLTSVQKTVEARGIEFVGIRMSALDEEIKKYDPEKAAAIKRDILAKNPPEVRPYVGIPSEAKESIAQAAAAA